ncbi:MAG: endonuclease/exonuclease/phosphatase family protein, partial [Verrucomicrobiales bacterium]
NDGAKTVTLTASAPLFDPGSASVLVLDADRPERGTSIRLATINTLNGTGARGSPDFDALFSLLERLEPDVIAFQEVSSAGDFFDLRQLLADLAFPYLATTDDEFTGRAYDGGTFNTDQNIAIASRYPIIATTQIGRAETSRMEIARFPVMVQVDVPDTEQDPTIVAVHYKAGTEDASRFRKAVEAYRTLEALETADLDGASDNLFVLGDFNEDHDRFMPRSYNTGITNFSDGSALPASYRLGEDISGGNSISLSYAQFPDRLFGESDLTAPPHRQQDGSATRTFIPLGDAALDYIIHSQRVADNGNFHTEIYNSGLDGAFDGISKQGSPAPPATSFIASDHFAVIGDYELEPKSRMDLNLFPRSLSEAAGAGSVTGKIRLAQPAAGTVSVNLATGRPDSPISLPTNPITFAPGEVEKTFAIDVLDDPRSAPDRTITISASAEGYSRAEDTLLIYNLEPSGAILISQYIEPPSGSSPRGIELLNCTGRRIDLRGEPVRVIQYTNGSTSGNIEAIAELGHLPAGSVVVIGDSTIGNHLVSEGILSQPDPPIASAENGTHYLNRDGELIYVKEFFPYNGDDALEINFAYGLSDVFGTIGDDPGSAWQSEGVSTSGRNLSLASDLASPSAGFTQPHRRFENTAPGNDLTGIGIPPAADDPFKQWLDRFGLSDPNGDPDLDGASNFIEFATGSDPTVAASRHAPTIGSGTYSYRQLSAAGRLSYSIEISGDLQSWTPADLQLLDRQSNGDGTDTLVFSLPAGDRHALRLRVIFE